MGELRNSNSPIVFGLSEVSYLLSYREKLTADSSAVGKVPSMGSQFLDYQR